MNKVHQFLRERRSIRKFKPAPIPTSVLHRILRTAAYAPSAHNLQPWRFVHITTKVAKETLGKALVSKMRFDMEVADIPRHKIDNRVKISLNRIASAPAIIMLCRDTKNITPEARFTETMNIQSTALAGLQLLLAAQAEGVSGNWICWVLYAQKETIKALSLPETWLPEAMFFLGYADEEPKEKTLKPFDELFITR